MVTDKKILNRVLALDISEESILAVEIQTAKGLIGIQNGFKINIPVFNDLNKTISELKSQIKLSKIKTRDLVVGFSMQYFKLFPVPIPVNIPADEIKLIVSQEGNISAQKEACSFFPLKNTQRQEADGISRYDVLGISCQKTLLETANLISDRVGFNLHFVTPSFLGLSSFLSGQRPNVLNATLWISQVKSELVIWSGQEPIYESLILTHQLTDQLVQTLNFIESQIPGTKINDVYTCGPSVFDTKLSEIPLNFKSFSLSQDIIDEGNVLKKLTQLDLISPVGLATVASGYSSLPVPNFINIDKPQTTAGFSKTSKISSSSKPTPLSGYINFAILLAICSIVSTLFINFFLLPGINQDISLINRKLNTTNKELEKVIRIKNENKIYDVKINFLSDLIDKRIPWSKVLKDIAEVTPKDLWIDRIDIRGKQLDIFGRSLKIDSVANFSINLNHATTFLKNSQIINIRKYDEDGVNYLEFQIVSNLNTEVDYSKLKDKISDDASSDLGEQVNEEDLTN